MKSSNYSHFYGADNMPKSPAEINKMQCEEACEKTRKANEASNAGNTAVNPQEDVQNIAMGKRSAIQVQPVASGAQKRKAGK